MPSSPLPRPFLKWAGGKAKLASIIAERAPATFGRYHEPFLGGGAVFFALAAAGRLRGGARLADANAALIACYRAVAGTPEALAARLEALAAAYLPLDPAGRRACYERIRACEPGDPLEAAARFIFLNRTCYNGLYRVNRAGRFNVPHGRYMRPRIADRAGLLAAARALAGAELACEDFEAVCAAARPGDFVYIDPPYVPLSPTASFTAYTSGSFGPREQERLAAVFAGLTRRGIAALLSNSDHPAVRALYPAERYTLEVVPMGRAINSVASGRAPVGELLIGNEVLSAGC